MMYEVEETPYGQVIRRVSDMACIPNDPLNRDYREYLRWLEDNAGNKEVIDNGNK